MEGAASVTTSWVPKSRSNSAVFPVLICSDVRDITVSFQELEMSPFLQVENAPNVFLLVFA